MRSEDKTESDSEREGRVGDDLVRARGLGARWDEDVVVGEGRSGSGGE